MALHSRRLVVCFLLAPIFPSPAAAPPAKKDEAKDSPDSSKDLLLETRRFVESKLEPSFAWQLPEPPKSTSSSKAKESVRVYRWAFVDLEAEKKRIAEAYDRAVAHFEEEAKKAKEEEKEKLEMKLARVRAERAQLLARYDTLRCRIQQVGDPDTYILLHARPLEKQVRLNDFVQSLRADLKNNFTDLKLAEDGLEDKRFRRWGWDGVRFAAEGKPNGAEGDARLWMRLLHFRKVTKQGRGIHMWIYCFAPSWKADAAFGREIERVLAGLVLGG